MANEYSRYPDNLDILGADGSLPEVPDKLSSFEPVALLSDNISPQTRDIPFMGINPSRIPKQGIVRIDDEIIAYKRIRANEGSNSGDLQLSTSTERGLAGTSAAMHRTGAHVLWLITSVHFKTAYEAIAELEKKVGVNNSLDPNSHDYRVRALERRMDGGDNAFIADTFTLSAADIARCYVELRQPVKTSDDVAMLVKGGPTQHVGSDLFISINNPKVVEWRVGGDLESILQPGDVVTVIYRAALSGGSNG